MDSGERDIERLQSADDEESRPRFSEVGYDRRSLLLGSQPRDRGSNPRTATIKLHSDNSSNRAETTIKLPESVKNWVDPQGLPAQVEVVDKEITTGKPHGEIIGGK